MKATLSMFALGVLVIGLSLASVQETQASSVAPPVNPRQVTVAGQVTSIFTGSFTPGARPQYFTITTQAGPVTVVVMPNTTSAGTKPLTQLRVGDRVRVTGTGGAAQGGGRVVAATHIVIG